MGHDRDHGDWRISGHVARRRSARVRSADLRSRCPRWGSRVDRPSCHPYGRPKVVRMADGRHFSAEQSLTSLVAGAIEGHPDAWSALVTRLERVVWKSVNMM